jgi:hypothetical protein
MDEQTVNSETNRLSEADAQRLERFLQAHRAWLDYAADLAIKLRDKQILTDGENIWVEFLNTARMLGTSRHEEAISAINAQLKIIKKEQRALRRFFWQRYRTDRAWTFFKDNENNVRQLLQANMPL